jgi:hypothetical protein
VFSAATCELKDGACLATTVVLGALDSVAPSVERHGKAEERGGGVRCQ